MKTKTMLEKFIRRLNWPAKKRHRFYNRFCWWQTGRIGRGHFGRHVPPTESRDMQLAIDKYNETVEE